MYAGGVTNAEIAAAFAHIATLLTLRGENPFKIRAYERAAQLITAHPRELRDLYAEAGEAGLRALPGIGEDLARKIIEMLTTGALVYHQELLAEFPPGLLEILTVEGMGPKKTKLVWEQFGVENIDALEALARGDKLRTLKGWGEKSVQNILRGIEGKRALDKQGGGRTPLPKAWGIAEEIVERLRRSKLCKAIEIAGSLRRRRETVGDIDILVTSRKPDEVIALFCAMPGVDRVLAQGDTRASVVVSAGIQCDLRVVEPDVFGAALHYFTGSKEHNVQLRTLALERGVTISEYGVHEGTAARKGKLVACHTEEDVFASVGLPWIPPEIREGRGEVDAAKRGALPLLLTPSDIKGDLHLHTDFSDGEASAVKMAKAAKAAGLEYIAITDHASPLGMVKGIKEDNLDQYLAMIAAARKAVPGIEIFAGAEVDILPDGRLYLSDAALAKLDWVVISVHQSLRQPREEMTERICRALAHPAACLLAHPTARLLGDRLGIEVDLERVFATAKRHGVALEHNASPERLDLCDMHLARAKELGVPVCVNSDAHAVDGFDYRFGISQCRRGWVEPGDVLNTRSADGLRMWLDRRRG